MTLGPTIVFEISSMYYNSKEYLHVFEILAHSKCALAVADTVSHIFKEFLNDLWILTNSFNTQVWRHAKLKMSGKKNTFLQHSILAIYFTPFC